ncbi:MAG: iron ABC transporter permease [Dehalococcoidales bacterium]|nr:iron ABC transporter permease [Dehalococcoidales bacterium]MDD3265369.1 iron ABC transporter permease [Dehalococcoidales bacterium]MDD4794715.1 iron ABC transporter permease [Dehalococcoidales bacterium]MDD5499162.1 iron ABC transporter permease [Dehalococcoidales bacterium]MDX9804029.1 iron ABC transporter permease [Dehalococcoidales bacterium]
MSKRNIAILIIAPLGLLLASMFIGRYSLDFFTALQAFGQRFFSIPADIPDTVNSVLFNIRLPRILMAMAVGAALSVSGASFQGMFKNPLVSPDILGVSAAAGFGAALAIVLDGNAALIQFFAFIFGLVGVVLAYLISRVYRTTPALMLVLSGVVVSAFFSALISVIKYIADPFQKLPAITFWLMGSLGDVDGSDLLLALPPIILGAFGLLAVRWRLNVLAMGDEEARSLGIKTELLKGFVILCATIATASAVCVSGIIGWVGLVIPHVGRMLVGPDHKALLPASISIGACYLLVMDNIARTAISAEIPLGILTAVIGAPFFAYLLRRTKGGWQ